MKNISHSTSVPGILISAVLLIVAAFVISGSLSVSQVRGAATGNDDPVTQYATSTSVWVGNNITTIPVASANPGRSYLEISNVGTSSPTAVFCKVGRTAALAAPTVYQGIVITASSTRIWGRADSVPVGFVRCIAAAASTTVQVIEK